jgi:hypothetical protein
MVHCVPVTTNRAQHFVPQSYLREFIDPSLSRGDSEYLWVYEQQHEPRPALPKEVAHQRDFYSFVAKGERNNLVDDYLWTLEDRAPKVRDFAARGKFSNENNKKVAAEFVGLMSARVPAARNLASDIAGESITDELREVTEYEELFRATYERLSPQLKTPIPAAEVRERLLRGERFRDVSAANRLIRMLDMGWKNADQLMQMNWTVWRSQGDELFVTSDNPVVSIVPTGLGLAAPGRAFAHPGVQIVFPLNPKVCLFATREAMTPGDVPSARVRRVNKMVMAMAERWLFASERSYKIKRVFDENGGKGMYAEDFYKPACEPK